MDGLGQAGESHGTAVLIASFRSYQSAGYGERHCRCSDGAQFSCGFSAPSLSPLPRTGCPVPLWTYRPTAL